MAAGLDKGYAARAGTPSPGVLNAEPSSFLARSFSLPKKQFAFRTTLRRDGTSERPLYFLKKVFGITAWSRRKGHLAGHSGSEDATGQRGRATDLNSKMTSGPLRRLS